MNELFSESNVTAEKLLEDDKFALAGEMYQIDNVTRNPNNKDFPDDLDRINIGFFPFLNPEGRHSLMIVPLDAPFKIYNQK